MIKSHSQICVLGLTFICKIHNIPLRDSLEGAESLQRTGTEAKENRETHQGRILKRRGQDWIKKHEKNKRQL